MQCIQRTLLLALAACMLYLRSGLAARALKQSSVASNGTFAVPSGFIRAHGTSLVDDKCADFVFCGWNS